MLTFENAGLDAAAPNPVPREASDTGAFANYAEAVWDTIRMNDVAQRCATAFFGFHPKGDEAMAPYFDLVEDAIAGVSSVDDVGASASDHTYWPGFQEGAAPGLRFERRAPAGD